MKRVTFFVIEIAVLLLCCSITAAALLIGNESGTGESPISAVVVTDSDCYFTDFDIDPDSEDFESTDIDNRPILGDVDGDGDISSADSLIALRISVGIDKANDISCIDVDSDGRVTSADALEILRFSVELPTNYRIGKPIE